MTNVQELTEKEQRFCKVTNFLFNGYYNPDAPERNVNFETNEIAYMMNAFAICNQYLYDWDTVRKYVETIEKEIFFITKDDCEKMFIKIIKKFYDTSNTNDKNTEEICL